MSVFLLPIEMDREIERIMNTYWWGCERERSRDSLREAKVENLLNMDKYDWDGEILDDLFVQEDVSLIKSIPIPTSHHEDRLIWVNEENGVYTVKSCYRKLQIPLQNQQPPFWTYVWKMKLPPKIKSFVWHLCSNSLPTTDLQCWGLLERVNYWGCQSFMDWLETQFTSQPKDHLCLLISVCWKFWEAKNEKKKLNVDAALDSTHRKMGFGLLLRDANGCFVAARQIPWHGLFRSDEAEVMGVKEALKWLKELNVDCVEVEMDGPKVITRLQICKVFTSFDLILDDIRKLANDFVNLSFLFAKRSANRIAHFLAWEIVIPHFS
ncbi:PREDICTED: uncharacterized protein LOC109177106 [Ipomoea nil]|uniref:uncharacterized protein LOC109177106 n=1 Tax=Ipomoea nil TaxID=35883 RepID=UPI0009016595|nr:PREDICTED: uncharacterized protein LOC109177106 [Ipomoea nil]